MGFLKSAVCMTMVYLTMSFLCHIWVSFLSEGRVDVNTVIKWYLSFS
jgi:hypothetical protein